MKTAQHLAAAAVVAAAGLGAAQAQPSVVQEWTQRIDGATGNIAYEHCDSCNPRENRAMAVDAAGDVFIAGHRKIDSASQLREVSKYAADGRLLWRKLSATPLPRFENSYAIALDAQGNALVTGNSTASSGSDYLTTKYAAADGEVLWEQRYHGNGGSLRGDRGTAIAVDPAGDVVVTGESSGSGIGVAYATVKYRGSDGLQLWASRYTRRSNENDRVSGVAVDARGDVFVTGSSGNYSVFATIKYDGATGAQSWLATYGTATSSQVRHSALGIAVDPNGDPVVIGSSFDLFQDFATVKYDGASGQQRWAARFDGGAFGADIPKSVAIDASGDVYVAGASYGGAGGKGWNMATIKYAGGNGAKLWQALSQAPWGNHDSAYSLALDGHGGVQVAGWATDTAGKYHPYAFGYSAASGATLWSAAFDQPPAVDGVAIAIKPAADGAYYIGTANAFPSDAYYLTRFHLQP